MNKMEMNTKLNPWQVTGLTDGEGAFTYSLIRKKTEKYTISLEFKVTQKSHSEEILYKLKDYFNCGTVVIDNRKTDTKKYHVTNLNSILNKIIPHFIEYPCLTSKYLNFNNWKEIASILNNNKEKSENFISEIKSIIQNMNKNRTFEEKYNFCNSYLGLISLPNGEFSTNYDLNPYWVQTFLTGEAMFYTYLAKKKSRGREYQGCDSSLEVGQNSHDIAVLISLKKFFGAGYIKPKYNYLDLQECLDTRSMSRFILRNTNLIINFVDKYPMLTRKQLDYKN
jgi:hypothetical protein